VPKASTKRASQSRRRNQRD